METTNNGTMISEIFRQTNTRISTTISHVLTRVNYENLSNGLMETLYHPSEIHTIVLFEYVHSGVYDTIAEMERVPGTPYFLHDMLQVHEMEQAMKTLFATKPNMRLYTRRKTDAQGRMTKYREYVLVVYPEMPSPIQRADTGSIGSMFDLDE